MRRWLNDWKRWKAVRDYPLIVGVTTLSTFDGEIVNGQFRPRPDTAMMGFYFDGTNAPPDQAILVAAPASAQ